MKFTILVLESHPFRLGRRDVRVWSPNPLEGFSCKSFLQRMVNPSLAGELVFSLVWRVKVSRKTFDISYACHRDVRVMIEKLLFNPPLEEGCHFLCRSSVCGLRFREFTVVASFFSLIEGFDFRLERRDVQVLCLESPAWPRELNG
ncbi:uncharacterized protein E6C27_scaffold84G001110 [Cucumis melo var. makuwa]|uniref:Uncharacterized protein n=1 Tax=Cucumis melo var. makuwa TaxID=1194695 RepID=A0A5A7T6A8_CUCMM|nr:uncharacterized protein E6C27_scaffold84G001110 [Cucumis melo var. makuwa]